MEFTCHSFVMKVFSVCKADKKHFASPFALRVWSKKATSIFMQLSPTWHLKSHAAQYPACCVTTSYCMLKTVEAGQRWSGMTLMSRMSIVTTCMHVSRWPNRAFKLLQCRHCLFRAVWKARAYLTGTRMISHVLRWKQHRVYMAMLVLNPGHTQQLWIESSTEAIWAGLFSSGLGAHVTFLILLACLGSPWASHSTDAADAIEHGEEHDSEPAWPMPNCSKQHSLYRTCRSNGWRFRSRTCQERRNWCREKPISAKISRPSFHLSRWW